MGDNELCDRCDGSGRQCPANCGGNRARAARAAPPATGARPAPSIAALVAEAIAKAEADAPEYSDEYGCCTRAVCVGAGKHSAEIDHEDDVAETLAKRRRVFGAAEPKRNGDAYVRADIFDGALVLLAMKVVEESERADAAKERAISAIVEVLDIVNRHERCDDARRAIEALSLLRKRPFMTHPKCLCASCQTHDQYQERAMARDERERDRPTGDPSRLQRPSDCVTSDTCGACEWCRWQARR